MKILGIQMYLDGGTYKVSTDTGIIFIDGRIRSETKGMAFSEYPDEPSAEQMPEVLPEILEACLSQLRNKL